MSLIVDIEKRLGAFTLRADLEARGGEALALLGPSGCGKTVTLKCVAGILTPDRGHIELDGRVLYDSRDQIDLPPQERQIGYLFQQYALFPNMTVEQNILCGIRRGGKAEKAELAAAQIRRFRLGGLEKQYPAQLSGGQQQRVALARILASGPQAVLLDEPFSALDMITKGKMHEWYLSVMRSLRLSTILITHDVDEAILLSDRICLLTGSPGEIRHEIRIPVPREDRKDFELTPEFLAYKQQVMALLRE
jgi:molybdate transport system ATP-binding protein